MTEKRKERNSSCLPVTLVIKKPTDVISYFMNRKIML